MRLLLAIMKRVVAISRRMEMHSLHFEAPVNPALRASERMEIRTGDIEALLPSFWEISSGDEPQIAWLSFFPNGP